VEFTIEQDVPSTQTGGSGEWDRYIYSWQCNYKGDAVWNVWDGLKTYNPSTNTYSPGWVPAVTPSGTTVACPAYTAGSFIHYYFHFLRLPNTHEIEFLDFTSVDSSGNSTYHQFDQTEPIQVPNANWGTGLFTAIQLDGDSAQTPYSVWADEWKVAYQ
jgi:hypothetical protein